MQKTLEERIQTLEDVESIKKMKARYMNAVDYAYKPDGIASFFTKDGIFDAGPFGRHEGYEALKKNVWIPEFSFHTVINSVVEVDGDKATGAWYLFEAMNVPEIGAVWGAARYEDQYVRVNGEWKIKVSKLIPFFFTPYKEGWENIENRIVVKHATEKIGKSLRLRMT